MSGKILIDYFTHWVSLIKSFIQTRKKSSNQAVIKANEQLYWNSEEIVELIVFM